MPLQRAGDDVLVADVADDQLGIVGKVFRPLAVAVDLLDQAVEDADPVAARKKLSRDGAADESCAAGDQDLLPQRLFPFLDRQVNLG